MKKFKVLILGKGRIGEALIHYFKKNRAISKVAFFSNENEIKKFDFLVGALPGRVGEKSLKLSLKYKKNLIDLADLEAEVYLRKRKEIEKKNILVIPNCGFCPGLINLILGREIIKEKDIKEIEIKAGTLSPKEFFFPFLWCFEDLILEHQIDSWQVISGKKKKFPPFADYQREKFFGITAESYFGQSDLGYLIYPLKIQNFKFRLVRPLGFFYFFQFLKCYDFFKKENFFQTKKILEKKKEDNLTLAEIKIITKSEKKIWQIKSFSRKREKLNSMQKITAIIPVIVFEFIVKKKIQQKGVLFLEKIGENKNLFQEFLERLQKEKIYISNFSKKL